MSTDTTARRWGVPDGRRADDGQPRLHVDWTRCEGRGLCAELLPEAITRDEWGFPLMRRGNDEPIPLQLLPAAREAVAACPVAALLLTRRVARADAPR